MSTTKPVVTDTKIEETLSQAKATINNIEWSAERINNILKDPLVIAEERIQIHTFSLRFISLILVCIIVVLGVLLFKFVNLQSDEFKHINDRLSVIEAKINIHSIRDPVPLVTDTQ